MSNQVDLTTIQEEGNWAIYLPSISAFMAVQMGYMDKNPNHLPVNRMPAGFENGHTGMDFLDKEKAYYYYKWGLYSAGHAELDATKALLREPMIHKRSKDTFLVGDSGGFQIASGVIKLDWKNVRGAAGDKLRGDILNFLENTANFAMTLDIPSFAAIAPYNKKTGLHSFNETVELSVHNLVYFIKNRTPGKTKFLNVLSGNSRETARIWYDAVSPFNDPAVVKEMGYSEDRAFEAFAFAGINMRNMTCVLERILTLRKDGLLKRTEWIHFLGLGRLDWACFLTSIKKQLQKHDNPTLNISYDAASPYVATAYGLQYTYNSFTPKKMMYTMSKTIDDKSLTQCNLQMPFDGPIMKRLKVRDVCYLGPTDPNKVGKIGRTSWDTFSYLLYMSHNVYNHIVAVQEANKLADIEYLRCKVNWRDWKKAKATSSINDVSPFIPGSVIYFNNFVEELLDLNTKDPFQMLNDNRAFLDSISFGEVNSNVFGELFDDVHQDADEDKFADMNNDKLLDLENENEDPH